MSKFCTKCGSETKDGKCYLCSQRTVSKSYLIIGIIFISVLFVLGIILGAVVPNTTEVIVGVLNTETESSFNWQLMLATWGFGVGIFIFYLAVYHLFTKLDIIMRLVKEK